MMWIYLFVLLISQVASGNTRLISNSPSAVSGYKDKLEVVKKTFGEGDPNNNDPQKRFFTGNYSLTILRSITVATFSFQNKEYLNCIGFSYDDKENECDRNATGISLHTLKLDRDEYVTDVSGGIFATVYKIEFLTNKQRRFGPFGQGDHTFYAQNNGKPLLYVEGIKGVMLHQITLVFHAYGVNDLLSIAETVARETFDKIKNSIEETLDVYLDYRRMLPDVAQIGCYNFQMRQVPQAETSCDLKVLLEQLHIMATAVQALRSRQPKNLLHLKEVDSAKLLDEVKEGRDFHELLTNVRFDLQTVIDATTELGQNIGNYFTEVAKFDKAIAEKDREFIQGKLVQMKTGTDTTTSEVSTRLPRIFKFAVALASIEVAERAVRVGIAVASNCNPLKAITGGIDLNEILDRVEDLAKAARNLAKAGTLLDSLNKFQNHMVDIMAKFGNNSDQLSGLKNVIDTFDSLDDKNITTTAEKFIKKYGDYNPQVSEPELAYIGTLLSTVADAACNIIAESGGTVSSIVGIFYETVTQDCTYIGPKIDQLTAYYGSWYGFQFELVDALASIVRGNIAEYMAQKLTKITLVIDMKTAAIGSVISEVKYQSVAHARCNILEYNRGGSRPEVCKNLLFRDDDIDNLIAYSDSTDDSITNKFAYIPTTKTTNESTPYISIDALLNGEEVFFQLPIDNKDWMLAHKWLPRDYNPETAFFVQEMEIYIPGLKCEDNSELSVRIEVMTGEPTRLYTESAPSSYLVPEQVVVFAYNEGQCAGESDDYPIVDSNLNPIESSTVCVSSKGTVPNYDQPDVTLPSIFSPYYIKLRQTDCAVIQDPSLSTEPPLITVRLKLQEVFAYAEGGTDECWPNPCPGNRGCTDTILSYICA